MRCRTLKEWGVLCQLHFARATIEILWRLDICPTYVFVEVQTTEFLLQFSSSCFRVLRSDVHLQFYLQMVKLVVNPQFSITCAR